MEWSVLRMSPLFNGLAEGEIEKILSEIPHSKKKYKAGSLIAQTGEELTSLKIVINGVVKGEMVDYSGRVIKIEDIPAPGALAPAFMFGGKNRYPVNVVAVSDAELVIIEKQVFVKLLKKNDRVLVNFLDLISNRSQFLSEKIKFLNFKTIKGKLAQFILQRAGRARTSIVLEMKQDDLADFFGVARPSVARALGEMEEEGLIEARGKNIRVLDKSRLAEMTRDRQ